MSADVNINVNSNANTPDCLFTLSLPSALEEEILDTFMTHPDLARGFTVLKAQGMGLHVELASAMERVQGRAQRVVVQVAMEYEKVDALIAILQKTFNSPQITYWVVPLLEFGKLG